MSLKSKKYLRITIRVGTEIIPKNMPPIPPITKNQMMFLQPDPRSQNPIFAVDFSLTGKVTQLQF